MKLYYYEGANFGDQLNPWLWPRLLPGAVTSNDSSLLVGIGTILTVDIPSSPRKFVFGTGAGYKRPPAVDEKWTFYCVRGPLTCHQLGLPPETAITDGALLVRLLKWPDIAPVSAPAFIPHHVSADMWDWRRFCDKYRMRYIDPAWDVERVIQEIRKSPIVYTEAMHGAILADAFRVPWVPLQIYPQINEMKWRDWMMTIGVEYHPVRLRALFSNTTNRPFGRISRGLGTSLERVLRPTLNKISGAITHAEHHAMLCKAHPQLSDASQQLDLLARLEAALSKLRVDISAA